MKLLPIFLISYIAGLFFCYFANKAGRFLGIVDFPDDIKIHKTPVTRWGGLGIFLTISLLILIFVELKIEIVGFLLGSLVIFAGGSVDDKRGMSAAPKFTIQIIASLVFILIAKASMPSIDFPIFGQQEFSETTGIILAVIWMITLINAFNFIDGLDGLAGGLGVIALLGILATRGVDYYTISIIAIISIGAICSFLFYNLPNARQFMGDSGSMLIGYIVGALSLITFSKMSSFMIVVIPIGLAGIPVIDLTYAVNRRLFKKQNPFKGDRKHLHHRLLEGGLSKNQVLIVVYFFAIILGFQSVVFAANKQVVWLTALILFFFAVLVFLVHFVRLIRFQRIFITLRRELRHIYIAGILKTEKYPRSTRILNVIVLLVISGFVVHLIYVLSKISENVLLISSIWLAAFLLTIFLSIKQKHGLSLLYLLFFILFMYLFFELSTHMHIDFLLSRKTLLIIPVLVFIFIHLVFFKRIDILVPLPIDLIIIFSTALFIFINEGKNIDWLWVTGLTGVFYVAFKIVMPWVLPGILYEDYRSLTQPHLSSTERFNKNKVSSL